MRLLVAAALAPGVAVYAWWAVDRPPFTTGATVAVVGAGLAAMAVRRRPSATQTPKRGVGAWVVLAGVTAAWQLASFVQSPREDHPTISSIANGLLDDHPTRAAAFALWLLAARALAHR
jgi:hypothetical protein